MTLQERIAAHFFTDPSRCFCHFQSFNQSHTISYHELLSRSLDYAAYYSSTCVERGELILIMLRHSPDQYYAFLGAMFAGCIPSFLPFLTPKQDPEIYRDEMRALLEKTEAKRIITEKEASSVPVSSRSVEELKQLLPGLLTSASQSDIAFLQHSSGTTGLRKGVILTHAAVLSQIDSYALSLGFERNDSILSWLPLYHDMGLIACCLLPMVTGIPLVSVDAFEWVAEPLMFFRLAQHYRCTHAWLPNFAFHHLCNAEKRNERFNLKSLKALINCSEPCRPETFDLFLSSFKDSGARSRMLQTCYAMAENVFAVTQSPVGKVVRRVRAVDERLKRDGSLTVKEFLSCGTPVGGVSVRIVDEDRNDIGESNTGEIAISGCTVFPGYFRKPEASQEKLDNGWYYTGDAGFMRGGELYVLGRMDDVIVRQGENLFAGDLEFALSQIEGVKQGRAVVFGVFVPELGTEEVVAMVEVEGGDLESVIRRKIMEEFRVSLHDVVCLPPGSIIKTTSGKISRNGNRRKYLQLFRKGRGGEARGESAAHSAGEARFEDILSRLLSYIQEISPSHEMPCPDALLLETGVIESLQMMNLLAASEEMFGVQLLASDLMGGKLRSARAIAEVVFERMSGRRQ